MKAHLDDLDPLKSPGRPSQAERQATSLLSLHPHFRGRGNWVRCQVANDCLYLSGLLPSYYLKQLAQEAVRDLEGVNQIVNLISVANPTGRSSQSILEHLLKEKPGPPAGVAPESPN